MSTDSATSSSPSPAAQAWQRVWTWAVGASGSTRSSAIIRIVLMVCLWTRWGDRFGLFVDPSWSTLAIGLLFYGSTFLAFIGLWTRPACFGAALVAAYCHYYLGLHEAHMGWTNHHMRLLTISTCLLPLTPCGKSYSIDRLLAVRRARREGRPPPPEHGDLWGLRLMALFLTSLYVSTAFHKTSMAWLSGVRMEHVFGVQYLGSTYIDALWWTASMQFLAISTWALEWFLPIGLWFRRTRRWAVIAGAAMHSLFFAFFEVYTFSANMIVLYLAFIPPEAVHDTLDRLRARPTPPPVDGDAPPTPSSYPLRPMWLGGALAALFLVLVPLRASVPTVFDAEAEPRDPIHPSSVPWVQLEVRPLGADPASAPIDWDALFDAEEEPKARWKRWPPYIRRVPSERGVASAVRKICAHVEPDVELYKRARVASADGWIELESDDDQDICRRAQTKRKRFQAERRQANTNQGETR